MSDVSSRFARPGRHRRRLGLALLATYAYRLGAAWLLALPVVHAVAASGLSRFPEGDRRLLEDGGMYLLEVLQREHATLLASFSSTLFLLLLFSFGALGPQWLTLRALRRAAPNEALPCEAARALPRLAVLGLLTWLARGVLLVATLACAAGLRSYFSAARDERLPSIAFMGSLALGLIAHLGLSVWHDVASAVVVEHDLGPVRAGSLSFGAVRRQLLRLASRYAAVGLMSLAVLIGCGMCVAELDVARSGGWRSLASVFAHQLAVLAAILLRSYWLACAVSAAEEAGRGSAEALT